MQYFGGKVRIAKPLSLFLMNRLEAEQPFVDLFCGSCNIITKIDSGRVRVANDINPYLIDMWKQLQNGWIPPKVITKEQYYRVKNNLDANRALSSFVGFGCSFAGKWWGGYAKSGNRNYCLNAYNSVMKKKKLLGGVSFYNSDYVDVPIPDGALVYCDIPYKNRTGYNYSDNFNHKRFYDFVFENKDRYCFYISEYIENVPKECEVVWEYESKRDIRNIENKRDKTIEVLMIHG